MARHQFLRINQDRREGRGQHQADDDRQHAGKEQAGIGQDQGERQHAKDRAPNHVFAPDPVTHRSADQRADGNGRQEHKQMDLRALHGHVESLDQIERVVRVQADHVEILGEDQRHQNADRQRDPPPGQPRSHLRRMPTRTGTGGLPGARIPPAHPPQDCDGQQRKGREPSDAGPSVRPPRSTPPTAARSPHLHCHPPGKWIAPCRAYPRRPCAPRARIPDGTPTTQARPSRPR